MRTQIYQVDAFTSRRFGGNPAVVCPLPRWPGDSILQEIASENNLAETAFLVRIDTGYYSIRCFTRTVEVPMSGHSTLAAAFVINTYLEPWLEWIRFVCISGEFTVQHRFGQYALAYPVRVYLKAPPPDGLSEALGRLPSQFYEGAFHLAVFNSEEELRALQPRFPELATVSPSGLIATAPARDPNVDFVSRFFAPRMGIDEDPATGISHCMLAPYWAARLERNVLDARQISRRGADLRCEVRGDLVFISGRCALYLEGTIEVAV